MKTRVLVSMLIIGALIFGLFTPASAVEIQSSEYISYASCSLTKGSGAGQITVSYSVRSGKQI